MRTGSPSRPILPALACALLAGCAGLGGAETRLAFVEVSGASDCTVTAQDRPFRLPDQGPPLRAELARLARTHGGAIIAAGEPAPSFRCRTEFLLALRKAGFKRVGFLGDPVSELP